MTGCTSGGYNQFETSPEAIEQELRPAVCERRQTYGELLYRCMLDKSQQDPFLCSFKLFCFIMSRNKCRRQQIDDWVIVNFIQVVVRGEIVHQRAVSVTMGVLTTLRILVTPQMSPSARLLVYYIRQIGGSTEVVDDAIWIDIQDECRNKVWYLEKRRLSRMTGCVTMQSCTPPLL